MGKGDSQGGLSDARGAVNHSKERITLAFLVKGLA
jgi:hypothetical protein